MRETSVAAELNTRSDVHKCSLAKSHIQDIGCKCGRCRRKGGGRPLHPAVVTVIWRDVQVHRNVASLDQLAARLSNSRT